MFDPSQSHPLLQVLSDREPEVAAHGRRVMLYALSLATALPLNDDEIKLLCISALLHDVGKLLLPSGPLTREGRLSPEEWERLKEHPQFGEAITLAGGLDPQVAEVVRHHHERWDGNGYPDRLRGEEIPLLARIIAVADAYDAMTSRRPYALPKMPLEALQELERCSGTQFDPSVVDLFRQSPPLAIQARHLRHPALSGITYIH